MLVFGITGNELVPTGYRKDLLERMEEEYYDMEVKQQLNFSQLPRFF